MKIELTETARAWLAKEGYDPQFGARPVRRTLECHVENPLAKRLLAGEFHDGDTVVADVVDGEDGKPGLGFNLAERKTFDPLHPWAHPPLELRGELIGAAGKPEPVTLLPMGATLLRRTCFPTVE